MIRLVLPVVIMLVVLSVVLMVVDAAKARVRGRTPKLAPKQRDYDWDRRRDQVYRRIKAVPRTAGRPRPDLGISWTRAAAWRPSSSPER
jgi:hypothetical protein